MNGLTLSIAPSGPVRAGATGQWVLTLFVREPLEAGASLRIAVPLGWTPPTVERESGRTSWRVAGRALILGEIVRRRHIQLNLTGGRLTPGDAVIVTYGDGAVGACAQPWVTDAAATFTVSATRDGQGPYVPAAAAALELEPGPAAYLHVIVPSGAQPQVAFPLRIRVLDEFGNLCRSYVGQARLPDGRLVAIRSGRADEDVLLTDEGIHRIAVTSMEDGLSGCSNPCRVSAIGTRPYWGDPHVHTCYSDGVASPSFALTYARDVACLDFTAITDHDVEFHHAWFTRHCQRLSDADWTSLGETIARYRVSGRFAVLRAYEWTGRPYGDRCVYFRRDQSPLHRYESGDAPTPHALWQYLRRWDTTAALVVPHTAASGFMGTDWADHDPDLETLVEIYSMHGASECMDGPGAMDGGVAGRYVRDALARGYRLGFVAGGDMHSSQPGNPMLTVGPYRTLRHRAGLTAVFADRLDESTVFDGMRQRRTYATTGARILVVFSVCDAAPGASVVLPAGFPVRVRGAVHGTAPLAEITVVRNGQHVYAAHPQVEDFEFQWSDCLSDAIGAYYYLRAVQVDGHVAWSSPVWVGRSATAGR